MRAISSFVALQSEKSESWKAGTLSTTVGRRRARGRQETRRRETRRQETQGLDPDAYGAGIRHCAVHNKSARGISGSACTSITSHAHRAAVNGAYRQTLTRRPPMVIVGA
jgi:hypothetical protein